MDDILKLNNVSIIDEIEKCCPILLKKINQCLQRLSKSFYKIF